MKKLIIAIIFTILLPVSLIGQQSGSKFFRHLTVSADLNGDGIKDHMYVASLEPSDEESESIEGYLMMGLEQLYLVCELSDKQSGKHTVVRSKNIGENRYDVCNMDIVNGQFVFVVSIAGRGSHERAFYFGYDKATNTVRLKGLKESSGGGDVESYVYYNTATGGYKSSSSYFDDNDKKIDRAREGKTDIPSEIKSVDIANFSMEIIDVELPDNSIDIDY